MNNFRDLNHSVAQLPPLNVLELKPFERQLRLRCLAVMMHALVFKRHEIFWQSTWLRDRLARTGLSSVLMQRPIYKAVMNYWFHNM
jgi:hypothetical protein